jgi:hypothetical protein
MRGIGPPLASLDAHRQRLVDAAQPARNLLLTSDSRSRGGSRCGWMAQMAVISNDGASPRARCGLRPLCRDNRVLGEPAEQRTQPLASAVNGLDVTHGVGLELAGGDE